MDEMRGRWALVTGASSGFGVEFATLLAERGANIVLAARRAEPMESLAQRLRQRHGVQVVVESIDLSIVGAPAELKRRVDARGVAVDVLVNNAGYGLYGNFIDQPARQTLEMLQLNILSVTEMTHVFAAGMVARRRGHILLIASLLGYQAVPGYAAYAASKGYVLLFGEALHTELEPFGVAVTVLSPGVASTSFGSVAGQRDTWMMRSLTMKPRPVASAGIRAMLRRRSSVVAGVRNKLIVFWNRFTPRRVQRRVMQRAVSGE
jgi:short-subunit dehydrogenase